MRLFLGYPVIGISGPGMATPQESLIGGEGRDKRSDRVAGGYVMYEGERYTEIKCNLGPGI